MISIDQLITFYTIINEGSQTKAEEKLQVKSSAIYTRLRNLEEGLKTQLIYKKRGRVELTAQGRVLYDFIRDFMPKLENLEQILNADFKQPTGNLKIATWHGVVSHLMPRFAIDFQLKNPDISLDISGDNKHKSFFDFKSDALILPYKEFDEAVDYYQIFSIRFNLYASKKYLEQNGTPHSLAELKNHRLIGTIRYPEQAFMNTDWHLLAGTGLSENYIEPHLVMSSSAAVYRTCLLDQGIAAFPDYYIEDAQKDKLVRLLPDFTPPTLDFYYIFERSMREVPKIKIFGEYLLANVPKIN